MEEIKQIFADGWADIVEAWLPAWEVIKADPAEYIPTLYGWACILVYLLFYMRRKGKLRKGYDLNISGRGLGKYLILRFLAGITMLAPGFFGNVVLWKTFRPIWEGPLKYPVWIAMALPFFALLAWNLWRDMSRAGVPVRLRVTTVLYSYMSTILYVYLALIVVLVCAIALYGRLMAAGSGQEGDGSRCPNCGAPTTGSDYCKACKRRWIRESA